MHETERPSVAKARPSTSLDSLHLSRHSYLALETQGIRTVEQLMVISEETLRNVAPLSVRFTEEIISKLQAFLNSPSSPWTSLKVLGLSVRSRNALMRAGIRTVEHLAGKPDREIQDVPGLGERSLNEIKAQLEAYRMKAPDTCSPVVESFSAGGSSVQVTTSEETAQELPSHIAAIKDEPIGSLNLTVRAHNCLKRAGRHTVGKLLSASDEDLLAIRQLGFGALAEIREKVAAFLDTHPMAADLRRAKEEPLLPQSSDKMPEPIEIADPSMQSSLEVLNLSARSYGALRKADCRTIGDVAMLGNEGLYWTIGYGDPRALTEIREKLDIFFSKHPATSRPKPLKLLGLSARPRNALMRHGVFTIDKLAYMLEEEIWDVSNIGAKSVAEITEKLLAYLQHHPLPDRLEPSADTVEPPPSPPPSPPLAEPSLVNAARARSIPLDDISVKRLALSELGLLRLSKMNIETVGDLAEQHGDRWTQQRRIKEHLKQYLCWLVEQDEETWDSEVRNRGISPLHKLALAAMPLEQLVEKYLQPLTSRERKVLHWRHGIDGEDLTLEKVGEMLNVTRERVRQIQNKANRKLQAPLRRAVIRPLFALLMYSIEQSGGVLDAEKLDAALRAELVIGQVDPVGVARLVFSLHDGVKWIRKAEVWGLARLPLDQVLSIQVRLANVLKKAYAPLPCETVIAQFKATRYYRSHCDELGDAFVTACLKSHQQIEIDESGLCGLTKWSKRKLDEVLLALRQIGRPAHFSVIAERANALLPSDQRTSERNIQALLERHSTVFVFLGRGKYWLRDYVIGEVGTQPEVDFGDVFGERLAHWQEELDRRQGDSELDTHAEVDRIRVVGLDFFVD